MGVENHMVASVAWYDNSILMTFIGVVLGALIGLAGSVIQSRIVAKNNIAVAKAQHENEIKMHYYLEKEKLYSELIGILPQLILSVNHESGRIELSPAQVVQLNSFKARLGIFSNREIYDEFYALTDYIVSETDKSKTIARMNAFNETLLDDLKSEIQ